MEVEIRELRKKDHKAAIQAAIQGMHLNWYTENKLLLNLYGKYFWYLELTRATQIIAAYTEDKFAGILLAKINGEKKQYYSFWKTLYVKIFDFLLKAISGNNKYDKINKEMYSQYLKTHSPNGEIIFFATNPEIKGKGIGSKLLSELEYREKGKEIYLYTDSGCTYQFYERRGFQRIGKQEIVIELGSKKVLLRCMLYSKRIL